MSTEMTEFDVLIFLKGVPEEAFCRDDAWEVAAIGGSAISITKKLAELNPRFRLMVDANPEVPFRAFIYRGAALKINDALKDATDRLEALLDGYSLLFDNPVEASSVVLARQVGDSDIQVLEHFRGGFATIKREEDTGDSQWQTRNYLLLQQLVKHFDFVSGDSSAPRTELREDLHFSLRMYRQGAEKSLSGLEFLAKFSALECLVCGAQTSGKEELLVERLGKLYYGQKFYSEDLVRKLWKLRCDGSHRARIALDTGGSGKLPAGLGTLSVEHLFAGVVYFVLDYVYSCETIDQVWQKVDNYSVPELVSAHRPEGVSRASVTQMVINQHVEIKGAGEIFDRFFQERSRNK